MPKRSSIDRDLNRMAATIVARATDEEPAPTADDGKNPHAVALGRLGGKSGGVARAEKLSAEERSEIARKAARARWSAQKKNRDV